MKFWEKLNDYGDSGYSARVRISAPGADIIPKWEYIRTQSADINELSEIPNPAKKVSKNGA